jgi:hypothetical protein
MDCKNVKTPKIIIPSRPCAAIPTFVLRKEMPEQVRQNISLFCFARIIQYISFLLLLLLIVPTAFSQRQLIVLKNEEVLARYQVGDVIHFARAKDKEILIQRILDLNDTLLMMNFDSVAYYRIAKLDIRGRKGHTFVQKLGRYMIVAGVLLPAIELLNTGVFNDEEKQASVSPEVLIVSGALVGVGSAMAFISKPYFKPGRKNHLMIVKKGSPFYKEKPLAEGYLSPYIPRN